MVKSKQIVRHFSEAIKKAKVKEFEEGKITAIQISRTYGISSSGVYKWIAKYGTLPKGERIVVEKESEALKTLHFIEKVKELERVVGQMHVELAYYKELVDVASIDFGVDIKKKIGLK